MNSHPECNYPGEVFGDSYAQHPRHYFNWLPEALKSHMELIQPKNAERRLRAYLDHLVLTIPEEVLVLDVKISQTHHFEPYDQGLNARPKLFDMIKNLGIDVIFCAAGTC